MLRGEPGAPDKFRSSQDPSARSPAASAAALISVALLAPAAAQFWIRSLRRSRRSRAATAAAIRSAASSAPGRIGRSSGRKADFSRRRAATARAGAGSPKRTRSLAGPGAGRRDGRLARLWIGRRVLREARIRHRAQASHLFRPGPLRSAARRRMAADRARGHRGGQAQVHRHDGRLPRSPADPRTRRRRRTGAARRRSLLRRRSRRIRIRRRAARAPAPPRRMRKCSAPKQPAPSASAEQKRAAAAAGPMEFQSEAWQAAYVQRIDATIAALKSANVPVFWVGLPPQRDARQSAASGLPQRTLSAARAETRRHRLCRHLGRLRRRGRPLRAARVRTSKVRSAACVPATASISRAPAPASSRTMSSAKSCAAWSRADAGRVAGAGAGVQAGSPPARARARPLAGPVVPLTASRRGRRTARRRPRAARAPGSIRSRPACWSGASRSRRRPGAPTISPGRARRARPRASRTCRRRRAASRAGARRQPAPGRDHRPNRRRRRRRRHSEPPRRVRRQPPPREKHRAAAAPRSVRRNSDTAAAADSALRSARFSKTGALTAAASSRPSGICRPHARPGGLRGSPTPPATGRAACRRRRTPSGSSSGRRACRP